MLALPTCFIVMPGPRVWFIFPTTLDVHGYSGSFIYYIRGILMMDFHGILRKDSCNTNSKQTWEGFVRGDWPQNDDVVFVMKRQYPSQRVFLNPTLGRAMMIWFRGYPIGTNQPLWCKGTQQIKSGQILASVRSNHDPTFAGCIWWCLIETLPPKRWWKLGKNIQVDELAQLLRVDWTQDWVSV